MCFDRHYECGCGHAVAVREDCMVARVNPLRCSTLKSTLEKKDKYWALRDCPPCEDDHKREMARMRRDVKSKADRLRRQLAKEERGY